MSAVSQAFRSGDFIIPVSSSYYAYRFQTLRKYIHTTVLIAGFINLMLLIPDLIITDAAAKIGIVLFRVLYFLLTVLLSTQIKRVNTFRVLSALISVLEILSVLVFLFVYTQYRQPNFLVQTIGLVTLIIAFFSIPNRWIYMLLITLCGTAGFFVCTRIFAPPVSTGELLAAAVYISFDLLICAYSAWISERHQYQEFQAKLELERLSSTDLLTSAVNRYKMEEEAARWMDFCRRHQFPLCLAFLDVDNMKAINDKYGHPTGDSVLSEVAELIRIQLRRSDVIARWGGDEFILLLPNISYRSAIAITERIKNVVREKSTVRGISVTCSVGVVEMKGEETFDSMIEQADILMYRAKGKGKDTVQWEQ